MTPHDLLANFEVLAEAPHGIQRLRELVLELAVRGKLVEQDPADEPAIVLLKRIKVEKTRLVTTGEVRQSKPLPAISASNAPYKAPLGWVWSRLGNLLLMDWGGGTPSMSVSRYWDGAIPWASVKDVGKQKYINDTIDHISEEGVANSSTNLIPPNSVLVCVRMGLGKVSINTRTIAINQDIRALIMYSEVSIDFLYNYFKIAKIEGSGMTVKGIKREDLLALPICLPPKAEQFRIVARVDELMALLDRLEAKRNEREASRTAARDSALAALRDAPTQEDVEVAWPRLQERFEELFTTPEDIAPLRQAILSLAVRGRLVKQSAEDQPARNLLQRREKKLSSVEEPWGLPNGWCWTTLSLLGNWVGGGTPSKSNVEYWTGKIPWVSPKDMKMDMIQDSLDHISGEAVRSSAVKRIPAGSMLMVVRGMILAHTFPVGLTTVEVTINQDMKALVPFNHEISDFLLFLLKSSAGRVLKLVERSTHGTCKLRFEHLANMPIPFPPMPEQFKILKKTASMLSLCNHLELTLGSIKSNQCSFADVAVHHLDV